MLNGINSFEERLKNNQGLLNFGYIATHPECKRDIWIKYQTDAAFKMQVDVAIFNNIVFKNNFDKYFKSFKQSEITRKRKSTRYF